MNPRLTLFAGLALGWLAGSPAAHAQAVAVTLSLETNVISVGSTTYLHAAAQILPAYRSGADRVFSWYVDVRNANDTVAVAHYSQMLKLASDQDPRISSSGFADGADRRGIYDTFMNLPGAGKSNSVELLRIPVTGLAVGRATFSVRPGSGVPGLSADFLVAPLGGGDPWLGGEYSGATVELLVLDPNRKPILESVRPTGLPGGAHAVEIRLVPVAGFDCVVQYTDTLSEPDRWQALPGGPHNSGLAVDTNSVPRRFYRIRADLR